MRARVLRILNVFVYWALLTYLLLFGAEAFWHVMNPDSSKFLPKPFVSDGADINRLWSVGHTFDFWVALSCVLLMQAITSFLDRSTS